jgi:hypothetical protein
MQINDKVYAISTDTVEEIVSIDNFKELIYTMKSKNSYFYTELLAFEQCANIFANKELETLILNYKK